MSILLLRSFQALGGCGYPLLLQQYPQKPSPRSLMSHIHSGTLGRTVMAVKNGSFKNVYQASMFKGEPLSGSNSGSYCRQPLISSISSPSGPPIQMSPKQVETFKHHLGQVDAYIFELHLLSRCTGSLAIQ